VPVCEWLPESDLCPSQLACHSLLAGVPSCGDLLGCIEWQCDLRCTYMGVHAAVVYACCMYVMGSGMKVGDRQPAVSVRWAQRNLHTGTLLQSVEAEQEGLIDVKAAGKAASTQVLHNRQRQRVNN
jgi:hypothetical protein